MSKIDSSFGGTEQHIKNNMPAATLDISRKFSAVIKPPSAINDSLAEINNAGLDNSASQSNTNEKVRVRTLQNNPTPPALRPISIENETVSSFNYNAPSSENTSNMAAFSTTFILIAGTILMVLTFLVSFMVFTFLGV